ncbi:calcium-binding protein, partial [Rhizobiaceae sp. 2RAB30]
MILTANRYDALDMASVAEFGAVKDAMAYASYSDGTLLYKSGDINIVVRGQFQPMPAGSTSPRSYYSINTIVTSINIFDEPHNEGWYLSAFGITFGKFYSARTIDALLNLTETRHIEGSFYDDNLFGGNANDELLGNEGNDIIRGRGGADALDGSEGNDRLIGDQGNDTLIGGRGADHMEGGEGNDYYFVDNAADQVIEVSGQGYDRIYATVNYAIAAGQSVEDLSA